MIVTYTNHRGERDKRDILPGRLYWGTTEYHTELQWILSVWDFERQAIRDFALKDIEVPKGTTLIEQ